MTKKETKKEYSGQSTTCSDCNRVLWLGDGPTCPECLVLRSRAMDEETKPFEAEIPDLYGLDRMDES